MPTRFQIGLHPEFFKTRRTLLGHWVRCPTQEEICNSPRTSVPKLQCKFSGSNGSTSLFSISSQLSWKGFYDHSMHWLVPKHISFGTCVLVIDVIFVNHWVHCWFLCSSHTAIIGFSFILCSSHRCEIKCFYYCFYYDQRILNKS